MKSQTKKDSHIRRKFCVLYQEEPRTENEMNPFWGSGLYDTMEKKEEIFLRHCDFFEWSELKKKVQYVKDVKAARSPEWCTRFPSQSYCD